MSSSNDLEKFISMLSNMSNNINNENNDEASKLSVIFKIDNFYYGEISSVFQTDGDIDMTKKEIKMGDNNVFHGSFTLSEKVEHSFNQMDKNAVDDKLYSYLLTIKSEIIRVCHDLEKTDQKEISNSYRALSEEIVNQDCDQNFCKKRLLEISSIAQKAGSVADPILSIIASVIGIFFS